MLSCWVRRLNQIRVMSRLLIKFTKRADGRRLTELKDKWDALPLDQLLQLEFDLEYWAARHESAHRRVTARRQQ